MKKPAFSRAAQANINETGVSWQHDLERVISLEVSPAGLLWEYLDGSDPHAVDGWRDYVGAIVDEAEEVTAVYTPSPELLRAAGGSR